MELNEKYLTAAEVAVLLRVTETHVNRLCRTGKIKAKKPFGQWLIDRQALYARLELKEQEVNNDDEGLEI